MGRQADRIGVQLEDALGAALKALTLEIDRELRRKPDQGGTPVDTGWARANWVPSVGTPVSVLGPAPTGRRATQNPARDAGLADVLAYRLGEALYVSNAVPYIRRLNEGHSRQAPRLFVEAAIDRAVSTVNRKFAGRVTLDRAVVLAAAGPGGVEMVGADMAANLAAAYNPLGGNDD